MTPSLHIASLPGVLLLVTSIILLWIVYRRLSGDRTRHHLPPGPTPWPLVGNIPQLIRSKLPPLDNLVAIAHEYGDIYRLRIVTTDVVVLNNFRLIREAFHHPDLQARPRITPIEDFFSRRNIGVAGSTGRVWREHRNFVHSALRLFGSRTPTIDDIIHAEAVTLLEEISLYKGKHFDPHRPFNSAVSNVISVLLFGNKFAYTDPDFITLQEIINENLQLAASGGVFIFIPFLARLPFSPANGIKRGVQRFQDFSTRIIAAHRASLDPGHPRDVIDLYLLKMMETSQDGVDSSFDETNMCVLLGDLFGASTETTNASLKWAILLMVLHPEVQTRVQEELDQVIGRTRLPTLMDRPKLAYTDATIHEIQRVGQVSPLGIAHACSAETKLGGYDIPEGALILANLWKLAKDGEIWNEPDDFRPERFLDHDGVCLKRDEHIPFSIGKRVCLGETIARKELFVFFSSLLHRFTFSLPQGSMAPSLDGRLGLVYNPPDFQVCVSTRHN